MLAAVLKQCVTRANPGDPADVALQSLPASLSVNIDISDCAGK
jgi:hypothetical protein